ncbi:WD40 repeat domain-containing serine/threonine protein kinase [Actinomadura parmotrematis]|uniref:non-specific serine/threonine protein kinase n=1 Tax=Actinomadura parmotrematis TaxID=2864039 RepID=A0ABS7FNB7_9ACTN|nr:serine/threonine-protein kinase [Actinomadura parmotrematis]MBW8481846.1 serine/threonine protein kinase [Actinomadura parmotrematis]
MADGQDRVIAGQYRLTSEIGRGGFGIVWRAEDERLHRSVAVKELFLPTYLDAGQLAERRRRSLREARSAARIAHPSAVTVYDVVEHEDSLFLIMELIDGEALNAVVRRDGPLPPRRVAEIGLSVLEALRAAHAAGVVHRDVKPSNVLIGPKRVVLSDFGIATIDGEASLTSSGFVMGAPAYTAPERARGEAAVPASDLWSLGATLFYAVEGKRPYPGANANAVFHAILNGSPEKTRRAGPLAPIIRGLLRMDPADRLTPDQLSTLLRDVAEDRVPVLGAVPPARRRARRARRLAAALPALAALVAAAGFLWPRHPDRAAPAPTAATTPSRLLATLPTGGQVSTLAISGDLLAAGGEDKGVRLWNLQDNQPLPVLRGPVSNIWTTAFSPDGSTLAAGGYDTVVYRWDVATRRPKARLKVGDGISSLSYSRDGRTMAVGTTEDVQLWDAASGKRLRTLRPGGQTSFITAYSRRSWLGVVGPGTVHMLRASGRDTTLGDTGSYPFSLAFDPAGTTVAVGTMNGRITLWNCDTGKRLGTLSTDGTVFAIAFSPDGSTIATGSGKTITLWNAATRERVASWTTPAAVGALAYRQGELISGGYDRTVRIWRV